ncbi:MAG: DUF1365 domain-containing protein [Ilumatobacteraceae bacterium]
MTTVVDLPVLPSIVDAVVTHNRHGAIRHGFQYHVYQWLVDLDELPAAPWYLRPVAGFDARDHLGGTGDGASGDIKTNVERFLARRGVHLGADGRVIMLANARVFGHVFDPLTVYWCFEGNGELRCVIAEVHNTFGERHAYVLTPGPDGEAGVDKQFYVSPFNDVSGRYAMRFVLDADRVEVNVSLLRGDHVVLDADLTGVPTPAVARTIVRYALRMPAMPHRVSALIRWNGIRLWLRRLPVVTRPHHVPQEEV